MSNFAKIGNSIFNSSKNNKNTSTIRSRSVFSETVKPNYLKKSPSVYSFSHYNLNKNFNRTNAENPSDFGGTKNNSTNFNFFNSSQNNYKKFCDLRNNVEFHSFNKNDYIIEANRILKKRIENKDHDLLGIKNRTKYSVLSDTKEICMDNFIIRAIKDDMNNISSKEEELKMSLINSENEFETDYKTFINFLENKKNKVKQKNATFLKCREIQEEAKERYNKELSTFKKLNEELEKKIKIINILKDYGSFVYKLLGLEFWMDEVPDLGTKNKNYEEIADLILKKYYASEKKYDILKVKGSEDELDDSFMLLKFNEFEDKVLKVIKFKENFVKSQFRELNYEEYINQLKKNVNILKLREKKVIAEKNRLMRILDNAQGIKQKDEDIDKILEYIVELGKETQKFDINELDYFEETLPKQYEKTVKEYDFNYYTVNTLNNLRKKERVINKFIEFIERVENSKDKKTIKEIEQERKNENKREKLKQLKLKQQKMHDSRNKRAIERNAKLIIIGRVVPQNYRFTKIKKLPKNKSSGHISNDMDLLFYNEEN